ncbi:MAG TPA: hypothetical protein VK766_12270 [Cytophagaceae bacterium]|jgi:hypothetical protein|nr:hypothetical protein [Cytophagaceae bacterium]
MFFKSNYSATANYFFLILAIVFAFFVSIEGLKYLHRKDAVDLGFRITGSRLWLAGKSPYRYVWKTGEDSAFYNQYEILKSNVTGVTVSPPVLLLTGPLASFSIEKAKWIWTGISYGLFVLSIFLFYKIAEVPTKMIVVGVSAFFFLSSTSWLLHIERGQCYIVYLFMLSAMYYSFKMNKIIIALCILCVLVWLRFPFAIFFLPFIPYLWDKKNIFFVSLCIAVLVFISYLCFDFQVWKDYFYAVNEWSNVQVLQADLFSDRLSDASRAITVGSLKEEREYLISNSSIQYLFQYHLKVGLFKIQLLSLFVVSASVFLFSVRKRLKENNREIVLIIAFMVYILFELFIPAPRYNYNFIQWMFPISLLIVSHKEIEMNTVQWFLLIVGLCMNMGLLIYIPRAMTIGEFLLFGTVWWRLCERK